MISKILFSLIFSLIVDQNIFFQRHVLPIPFQSQNSRSEYVCIVQTKFLQLLNCRHAIYHYSFLVVVQTTQKGLKGSFQSANSASASDAAIGSSLSMVIFLGGLSIRNSWSRWANSCSTHFTDSSRTTLAAIYGFEHTVNTLVDKYLRTAKRLSYFNHNSN